MDSTSDRQEENKLEREKSFGDGMIISQMSMNSTQKQTKGSSKIRSQATRTVTYGPPRQTAVEPPSREEFDALRVECLPKLLIFDIERKAKKRREAALLRRRSDHFDPWSRSDIPEELRLPALRPPTAAQLSATDRTDAQHKRCQQFSSRRAAYEYMLDGWLQWNNKLEKVRKKYLELINPKKKIVEKRRPVLPLHFDTRTFINSLQKIETLPELPRARLKGHAGTDLDYLFS